MPDPAEIIADTITQPPSTGMDGPWWQFNAVMAQPSGPVQALADAGWRIVPGQHADPDALPSPAQMRSWLRCHEWKEASQGKAGALWFPPVPRAKAVGVPDDDSDPDLISGAIQRIADRMAMSADQVLAEMLTYA